MPSKLRKKLATISSGLLLGTASIIAMLIGGTSAYAADDGAEQPDSSSRLALNVIDKVPAGFEDIDESVETLFDIYLSGQRLGTSPVRVANGKIIFLDPQGLVEILPDRVIREKVLALVTDGLPTNEALRCLPGRTADCGVLPSTESGVVVNTERFSLELFLTQDFYRVPSESDLYLADPVSGPSFIQTALVSLSTGNNAGGGIAFGATLDTLASLGRTSFVGQTLIRENGANIQRAYVQHYWRKRSAAAGLLQQSTALTFNSYRLVGAEYGSFFGARRDISDGLQTPIEIVLPRSAQVEIYRDNVLIQTLRLDAGVQRIPTVSFPSGSYPVRIIARDSQQIILDETRVFTKATDLPPLGEWAFRLKAGVRVSDFDNFDPLADFSQPFLPTVSGDSLFSASVARQILPGIGASAEILAVKDKIYAEGSVSGYLGKVRGVAAASAGTDGAFSVLVNANAQIGKFDLNLVARHTKVNETNLANRVDQFRPYFRSEDSIIGGVSFPLVGGSLTLNASYTRTPNFDDRYTVSGRYSKTVDVGSFGAARLSAFALKSTSETRAGIAITFVKRLNPKTIMTYSGGAEYRSQSDFGASRSGAYPLAEVRVARQDSLGTIDLNNQAGIGTDSDRHRAFASTTATSNFGTLDLTADFEKRRDNGDSGFGVSANLFTGVVVGGGQVKLGPRQPGGDAALMVKINNKEVSGAGRPANAGRYRVLLGNQYIGSVEAGKTTVLSGQSFREYRVGLQPEGSPPFSIDLSIKKIPLYPGNVAVVTYEATRVVTVFGRLVDKDGKPRSAARISGLSDTVITDELGYFIFTANSNDVIDFYSSAEKICSKLEIQQLMSSIKGDAAGDDYIKVGDIRCE